MKLIDADHMKRYIDCGHLRSPSEVCLSELDVVRMLDRMPTIEAEPVRYGRWVYDDEVGIWKCSLCNRAAISSGYGQELSEHCPRCGARMVGG